VGKDERSLLVIDVPEDEAVIEARKGLTTLQQLFAEYFAQVKNATKAAQLAGYAKGDRKRCTLRGFENTHNKKVMSYVRELMRVGGMSGEEIVDRYTAQARSDLDDFLTVSENEKGERELLIDWEKAQEAGVTHLVKKYSNTPRGVVVELWDQQVALDRLARMQGLYKDTADHRIGVIVSIGGIDLEHDI